MSATRGTPVLEGCILTPEGWVDGRLVIEADRIARIDGVPAVMNGAFPPSARRRWILPGFIDLHVHGGGGADCMEGANALETLARTHARYGTTSLLATTMTAPRETLEDVLSRLAAVCERSTPVPHGARVLGVHLEGPYINRERLGAQPDAAVLPVWDEIARYLALAPIRVVTLAPELHGQLSAIAALAERGVRVQLGHTAATYEQAVCAMQHGATGFTHLFNASSSLHHRAPGVVGAALAHAQFAEMIPDLIHVHPGAIRAALRAIPQLYCVTDGTAACGMPDGDYRLGSQPVHKCLGAVRLGDGTLAGSTLTMDQALRNLLSLGLTLDAASKHVSAYPADYLGLTDRGTLRPGSYADIVAMDAALAVEHVFVEGNAIVQV